MQEETLLHAAKRVVRFVKINDTKDGGLLTQETVIAVERLRAKIEDAERGPS